MGDTYPFFCLSHKQLLWVHCKQWGHRVLEWHCWHSLFYQKVFFLWTAPRVNSSTTTSTLCTTDSFLYFDFILCFKTQLEDRWQICLLQQCTCKHSQRLAEHRNNKDATCACCGSQNPIVSRLPPGHKVHRFHRGPRHPKWISCCWVLYHSSI